MGAWSLNKGGNLKVMIEKGKKKVVCIGTASLAFLLGIGGMINHVPFTDGLTKIVANEGMNQKTVINENTVWKYLDNNQDPAKGYDSLQAWTTGSYPDDQWSQAAGKFGAKKGKLKELKGGFTPTVLLNQYYQEDKNTYAFFFRTTFTMDAIENITSLSATLHHDDEAAVYLNGHEIFSDLSMREQDGKKTNLYYSGHGASAPETTTITLSKEECKKYLQKGENVLAVEVHNDRESSSDIYFEFENMSVSYDETQTVEQKSAFLTIGRDETSKNVTWYANDAEPGMLQYAPATSDGNFPKEYQQVQATSVRSNDGLFYSNQAEMNNLKPNTDYVYRFVNKDQVSDVYRFHTNDFDGSFHFLLAGDPQIGAGNTERDTIGWDATLHSAIDTLHPDFLVSAGDQVNTASNEQQYQGYLNDVFNELPSATTIGNHDSGSDAYSQHFNLPNVDERYGTTKAGSDYSFVYNNTLFMNLNSNNRSIAEHKAFMEQAIAANPDVTWKTVIFHHSIYSTASHYDDGDIIQRRNEFPPVFDELGIDVVLMGHDHVYTRTYMMEDGFTPVKSDQDSVTDPEGILYITANSASSSKYYDIKVPDAEFSAKMDQSYRRTISDIEVTDTSYTVKTYFADDMSELDSFTIYKTAPLQVEDAIALLESYQHLQKEDYTPESWDVFDAQRTVVQEMIEASACTQEELDEACATLTAYYQALQKITSEEVLPEQPSTPDADAQEEPEQMPQEEVQPILPEQQDAEQPSLEEVEEPQTGDHTNYAAFGMLMLTSAAVMVLQRKQHKKENE